MISEKEIIEKLTKELETKSFKRLAELPDFEPDIIPDLVMEYDRKIIYFIEAKLGSPGQHLPYGLFPSLFKIMNENTKYFSELGFITRTVLITNQEMAWDKIIHLDKLIKNINISEISEILINDVSEIRVMFDQYYKNLFLAQPRQRQLQDLQRIAQINQLLDTEKVNKIINNFKSAETPEIRGEICYLLGRWGKREIIPILVNYLKDSSNYVRSQAQDALLSMRSMIEKQMQDEQELNEKAYKDQENELLNKFSGQYAAFYGGKLVMIKSTKSELIKELEKADNQKRYFIRKIVKELPKVRLPKSRRLLK